MQELARRPPPRVGLSPWSAWRGRRLRRGGVRGRAPLRGGSCRRVVCGRGSPGRAGSGALGSRRCGVKGGVELPVAVAVQPVAVSHPG